MLGQAPGAAPLVQGLQKAQPFETGEQLKPESSAHKVEPAASPETARWSRFGGAANDRVVAPEESDIPGVVRTLRVPPGVHAKVLHIHPPGAM